MDKQPDFIFADSVWIAIVAAIASWPLFAVCAKVFQSKRLLHNRKSLILVSVYYLVFCACFFVSDILMWGFGALLLIALIGPPLAIAIVARKTTAPGGEDSDR